MQNAGVNLLTPRLQSSWSKPVTKPVRFFDSPFTLEWINAVKLLSRSLCKTESSIGKSINVINVTFNIFDTKKYILPTLALDLVILLLVLLRA
jgi:hypothetical protein